MTDGVPFPPGPECLLGFFFLSLRGSFLTGARVKLLLTLLPLSLGVQVSCRTLGKAELGSCLGLIISQFNIH